MTKEEPGTLIPTSGVGFDDQVKVLRAYVVLSNKGEKSVHYTDVVKITRLARTQVSGVNSFFIMLGFLERISKGRYRPTKAAIALCRGRSNEEESGAIRPAILQSLLYRKIHEFLLVHHRTEKRKLIEYLLGEASSAEDDRAESALEWLAKTGIVQVTDADTVFLASDSGGG